MPEAEPPTIRVAKPRDGEVLRPLLGAQLREHGIPIEGAALGRAIEGLLAHPERGRLLLAEHGGRAAWLEELYVEPGSRCGGTGTALLRAALAVAADAGARAVDLEVEDDHARVTSLYLRHGFRAHTRRRFVRALASRDEPVTGWSDGSPSTAGAGRSGASTS